MANKERDAIIEDLYAICQKFLDTDDLVNAFKLAGIIMRAEQGTSLEILNKRLAACGITVPLEVYVEQKEGEVDIITDEGETTVKLEEENGEAG